MPPDTRDLDRVHDDLSKMSQDLDAVRSDNARLEGSLREVSDLCRESAVRLEKVQSRVQGIARIERVIVAILLALFGLTGAQGSRLSGAIEAWLMRPQGSTVESSSPQAKTSTRGGALENP